MSMARGCMMVEREPGKWFCVIACYENDWDFREYNIYGPASSEDEAADMMSACESNPGGWNVITHDGLDERTKALVDSKPPVKRRRCFDYGW